MGEEKQFNLWGYKKGHFAWSEQINIQFGKKSSTSYVAKQQIPSTMKIKEKNQIVLIKFTDHGNQQISTDNNLESK